MDFPDSPAVNNQKESRLPRIFLPVLLTFVLTSLFVGGTIWGWQEARLKKNQTVYETQIEALKAQLAPSETQEEVTSPQKALYANDILKVSLEIPTAWQGRYEAVVISKDPTQSSGLSSTTSLIFNFLGKRRKAMLFSINQTDALTWSDMQFDKPVPTNQKLYEKGNVVYYYDFLIDNPFTEEEAEEYKTMADQVPEIITTFKLLPQE